jgi:hypothetical protein
MDGGGATKNGQGSKKGGKEFRKTGWARMIEQSKTGKGRTEEGGGRRVRMGKGNEG